jgi:hypothetical protein
MNALIASAPADIAGHATVDFCIGRCRLLRQQRRRLHDLTGLTIAALRHTQIAPRDLNR